MNARQETQIVKKALIEAGFDKKIVRVGHDTGTAAGWLNILVNQLAGTTWQESEDLALATIQRVTGRHGDDDGRIMISIKRPA